MEIIDDHCKTYGSPVKIWGGTSFYLMVHDPEDVDFVLKSPHCQRRMYLYSFLREAICDRAEGLFTSNGAVWKRHRRYIGPAFGSSVLYDHLPIFNRHVHALIENLANDDGHGAQDIRLKLNRAAMNLFLESMLGTEFLDEDKATYARYLTE